MTVYKDPVTGRFGTPPPGALPAPRARATAAPLPELVSPGGGSYILLDGRSQNYVTARVREDGTLETDCGEARP